MTTIALNVVVKVCLKKEKKRERERPGGGDDGGGRVTGPREEKEMEEASTEITKKLDDHLNSIHSSLSFYCTIVVQVFKGCHSIGHFSCEPTKWIICCFLSLSLAHFLLLLLRVPSS